MFRIFMIIAMMWSCGALTAMAQVGDDPLVTMISKLNDATDAGDTGEAAVIAARLASSDFSNAPLSPLDVREFKASLAETIALGGKQSEAKTLLIDLIAADTAAIKAEEDKAYSDDEQYIDYEIDRLFISDTRAASAERKLQLADLYLNSKHIDQALDQMSAARDDLGEVYGIEADHINTSGYRVDKTGSSDAQVREIAITNLEGHLGSLNPAVGYITEMMVDTAMAQTFPRKHASQKSLEETLHALRYLYKVRLYITDQCNLTDPSNKPECGRDEDGRRLLPTMTENAIAIAEHWRAYARFKRQAGEYIAAYVALDEARYVLERYDGFGDRKGLLMIIILAEIDAVIAEAAAAGTPVDPIQYEMNIFDSLAMGEEEFDRITVFYGTTREDGKKYAQPDKSYRGKRNRKNSVSYGSINMTVPWDRTVGSVPAPSFLSAPNPSVHILLRKVNKMDNRTEFETSLAKSVNSSARTEKEALIFIHGHAETFASAARRTAQLAVDLDIPQGGTFFTWPAGSVVRYDKSEKEAALAAKPLAEFLSVVARSSGADKIHIIAHSMGNRVLLKALQDPALSAGDQAFEQIIWASPDVDSVDFANQMSKVEKHSKGMTLYASANDKALKLSEWLHDKLARAGQSPPLQALRTPDLAKILTTVDTTVIDPGKTDFVAHSDYTGGAITDLQSVVWLSLSPDARCITQTGGANPYWQARYVEGCGEDEYSMALRQIRDHGRVRALSVVPMELQRVNAVDDDGYPVLYDMEEEREVLIQKWEGAKTILKARFAVR